MNIFTSKDRLITRLKYPIVIISVYMLALHLLSLILPKIEININVLESFLWSACCGGFVAFFEYKDSGKSLATLLSVLGANATFYLVSSNVFSLMFSLAFSLLIVALGKNIEFDYMVLVSALLGVVVGACLGLVNAQLQSFVMTMAQALKGRAMLFGVANEVYSLLFGDYLSSLVYHTDIGTATVVDGRIVAGAVDIFRANVEQPFSVVASYLTGKYYVNIFLAVSIAFALLKKARHRYLLSLLLPLVLSVIFGDNSLLALFLFFYNPLAFVGYALVGGVGYFVSELVDIRIGFDDYASTFALLKYGKSVGWFALVGIVLCVLMYFVVQIAVAKLDFDNQRYYPKEVRQLVKALGGEKNIEKIEDGVLIVRNPNLIDIIKVDCEIYQNTITLIDNDYNLLKEYF